MIPFFLFNSSDLTESTFKYQLLGLNLLCLLSQNRVSEFHTVSINLPIVIDQSDHSFFYIENRNWNYCQ